MLNIQKIDNESSYLAKDEKELLKYDPETVRSFYSLTGPARKEYAIQMAEAEADRIRIVRQAQADGLLAIRKAEAEGFTLIGEALAKCENPELIMKLAGLMALQDVAQSLADGKATKFFLPQSLGDIMSLLSVWKEAKDSVPTDTPPAC
jgi:hypothetical protein